MHRIHALPLVASLLISGGQLLADEPGPLPLGQTQRGQADEASPTIYRITVTEPGILTVAIRADDDHDIALDIADSDGQTLPDGFGDWDLNEHPGTEQIVSTLGSAGDYLVYVSVYEESAGYVIGSTYLAMPEVAQPEDPNGRPGTAIPLALNEQSGETIRPARGDHYDWYVVTPARNGTATVFTRSSEDLILNAYEPGEYHEAIATSDSDDQSELGNESVTLDIRKDEPLYFRVSTFGESADYTIKAGMVGEAPPQEE